MTLLILLSALLLMPCSVLAMFGANNETDFWDDFANNFATDLAPVIALFGEQVTKQFLSESTTILDVIVFAVGPLGIITAVVSCIRVSNSTFLKSIIGRAREPHGISEVELCSSTSENVCELWSNGGICRVFGRPKILEFVYKKPSDPGEYRPSFDSSGSEIPARCGIESTRDLFNNLKTNPSAHQYKKREGYWKSVSSSEILRFPFSRILSKLQDTVRKAKMEAQIGTDNDMEGGILDNIADKMEASMRDHNTSPNQTQPQVLRTQRTRADQKKKNTTRGNYHVDIDRDFAPFPNLALNTGGPTTSKTVLGFLGLWTAAILGILLQASFFGYAIWATRYKRSFYEDGKIPSNPAWFILTVTGTASIVGGMALCAQVIDSISKERRFVFYGSKQPRMFWLQPAGQRIGDQEFDGFAYNQTKTHYITSWKTTQATSSCQWRVWLAVILSTLGWVMQFVGLRGVHGTVSLYQIAITFIMSIVRGSLRSCNTPPDNQLSARPRDMTGHELDWQAIELANIDDKQSETKKADFWFIDDQSIDIQDDGFRTLYGYGFEEVYWSSGTKNIFLTRDYKGTRTEPSNFVEWIESREPAYWLNTSTETALKQLRPIIKPDGPKISELLGASSNLPQPAARLVRIRSRLAFLTNQPPYQVWDSDVREMAGRLKCSLQRAARILATGRLIGPFSVGMTFRSIVWTIGCRLTQEWRFADDISSEQPICFHMFRMGDSDSWSIDSHQLEAVLGLWLWSFQKWRSQHPQKLPTGIKPFAVHQSKTNTLRILLQRWGVETRFEWFMTLGEKNDLSVPTLTSLQPRVAEPRGRKFDANIPSVDSTASILNLMAQDIFTLFLKRIALVLENSLNDILYPSLQGSVGSAASLVDDLTEVLISERLATREEAIMTIIAGLYQDSAFQQPLHLQLISEANSLKRQNRFDESEQAIQRILETGAGSATGLAAHSLCELYRCELRYMSHNPRIFTVSELQVRAKRISQRINTGRFLSYTEACCYLQVLDKLLHIATTNDTPKSQSSADSEGSLHVARSTYDRQPLDEGTLARLDLDRALPYNQSRQHLLELHASALTLADEYDLGASDIQVRKQLLRWAIEKNCCGLVEDLWSSERRFGHKESIFGQGSDELFWALLSPDCTGMATMQFLLDVVQVPATEDLKQKDQMEEPWWSTSQLQDHIKEGYEKYDCLLTVASSELRGLEYVQLLAGSRTWSLPHLHEAVLSALESGTLETVNYLYSRMWQWEKDESSSQTWLLQLLETASLWGLNTSVKRALAGKKRATAPPFSTEDIEVALEAARKELPEEKMKRAQDKFHYDKDGVLALLLETKTRL